MAKDQANIIFAGTPEFACPALKHLLHSGYRVSAVYTQPDRPAGRGRQLQASAVKKLALEAQLPVYQPEKLKNNIQAIDELRSLKPDLMVVAAYGLILPPEVLAIPKYGCVNIHASLLPRWRGAAPIQRAIQAGDDQTGVGIMAMAAGLDTGDVYLSRCLPIEPQDTAASLHDKLATLGATTLIEALPGILSGELIPVPQDESHATYAEKLTKAEAKIEWSLPASVIDRNVRAFYPWPIAYTNWHDGKNIRILSGYALEHTTDATAGTIIKANAEGLVVATGAGQYVITYLQPEGRKAMKVQDYLNAHDVTNKWFV